MDRVVRDCKLNLDKNLDDLVNELLGLLFAASDDGDSPDIEDEVKKIKKQQDRYEENFVLTICNT